MRLDGVRQQPVTGEEEKQCVDCGAHHDLTYYPADDEWACSMCSNGTQEVESVGSKLYQLTAEYVISSREAYNKAWEDFWA